MGESVNFLAVSVHCRRMAPPATDDDDIEEEDQHDVENPASAKKAQDQSVPAYYHIILTVVDLAIRGAGSS